MIRPRPRRPFPFLLLVLLVLVVGIALLYLPDYGSPDSTTPPADSLATDTPVTSALDSTAALPIDTATGLVVAEHYPLVKATCTACHGGQLVAQNRASREGWLQMIRWMQRTQGLWDLGPNEDAILDYLATHYAPQEGGRRAPLTDIEWYELNE
ncbi:hypothetical protein SAMN05421823_11156 [Catalinimonas alkaloidigena]|uniref:Cytochrome c domain-containing protein n=1 Tax=Catalinimonas alkaloidigena TaxID=1075417 RepID=A0A1G9R6U9_9BACT|nr:hypothetical protein [Catalinimonas alkaloidigena]SDM18954.1 hypothetical protein SAMN05421823_11156 [Catalinimonas alkaloidigena]